MQELAEILGISRTTVSLVLKGKGDQYRISRQTQEKILKLVEEENYKPNYFAQALNRKKTQTIGIIFPDLFEEFMVEMIRGIEDSLAPHDYSMVLMTSRFRLRNERKNLEELLYRGADGILLVPTCHYRGEDEERGHIRELEGKGTKLVMIDRLPDFWTGPAVLQDDAAGAARAADYLKAEGCGSFLSVSLDLTASSIRKRLEEFKEKLPEAETIVLGEQNPENGDLMNGLTEYMDRVKPDSDRPAGIFVTTSGLALRVNEILQDGGYALNREYRIIRFGNDPKGYESGMASIPQPHYEMGRQGASLLLDMIEKKEKKGKSAGGSNIRKILDLPFPNQDEQLPGK